MAIFEFDKFVLELTACEKQNVPELSWLTSSQFEVGGVAIPTEHIFILPDLNQITVTLY